MLCVHCVSVDVPLFSCLYRVLYVVFGVCCDVYDSCGLYVMLLVLWYIACVCFVLGLSFFIILVSQVCFLFLFHVFMCIVYVCMLWFCFLSLCVCVHIVFGPFFMRLVCMCFRLHVLYSLLCSLVH